MDFFLQEIVEPSACSSTAQASPPEASLPTSPTTTPRQVSKKRTCVIDFLYDEAKQEQRRHEESEEKTDPFLALFETVVGKL